MTKKTALNILILVIVAAVLFVSYILFFQKEDTSTEQQQNNNSLPIANNFFPESETSTNTNTDNEDPASNTASQNIPKLRQISDNPTSGFTLTNKTSTTTQLIIVNDTSNSTSTNSDNNSGVGDLTKEEEVVETETLYTFINRSNGNIYEASSKSLNLTRLTNTTIPKVYDAYFVDNRTLITQQLEDGVPKTFFINLVEPTIEDGVSTSTTSISSPFWSPETLEMPVGIKNILNAENGLVFYTVPQIGGGLVGTILDSMIPEVETEVFNTKISYLNFSWLSDNILLFGTKPNNEGGNLLFSYNIDTRKETKILDSNNPILFLPNKNTGDILILDGQNTFIHNSVSGEEYSLDINTTVNDKCVWGNEETGVVYCAVPGVFNGTNSLISWYKGETSFNDSLYKIDTASGVKTKVGGLGEGFDIIKPQLSEDDTFFVFINKKDLTLWSLDLKN